MRRTLAIIFVSLVMAMLPLSISAQNRQRIFSEISSLPGVESVYIGPAALRLASSYTSLEDVLDGSVGSAIKDLKSIEIIQCKNRKSIGKIRKFAVSLVNDMSLDIIIESQEEDDVTRIYGIIPENSADSDSNVLHGLLIETSNKDEYDLIFVRGTIDLSKLELNK